MLYCAASVTRVVLTLNLVDEPEPPAAPWPFVLQVRRNARPWVLAPTTTGPWPGRPESCVCEPPDVRLLHDPFGRCLPWCGSWPWLRLSGADRCVRQAQDNERALPTLLASGAGGCWTAGNPCGLGECCMAWCSPQRCVAAGGWI